MTRATTAEWRVATGDARTTAVYEPASAGTRQMGVFVCAHGAGGHMNDRGMLAAANALRSIGLGVVRFNFPYREKKSARPDPMPKLKECVAAVVERTREAVGSGPLVIGGRSMGGRAASMLAAEGFTADGLLLMAYPLHPSGRPEQLRDAHLPAIEMPVLCFNGTRDTLCDRGLMETALQKVRTQWTMHWLEGADHGFHVRKSSGRTDTEILDEIGTATQPWISALRHSA